MLTVSQFSKSFGGRALFDDVSLQVNRGNRIGLVGPNGACKSTLFALLLGDVSPDNRTMAIERTQRSDFFRRKPPFKFEKRCQLFVGGNDGPVSIVAMHSNIAFDFVELKLDGVLHDG